MYNRPMLERFGSMRELTQFGFNHWPKNKKKKKHWTPNNNDRS